MNTYCDPAAAPDWATLTTSDFVAHAGSPALAGEVTGGAAVLVPAGDGVLAGDGVAADEVVLAGAAAEDDAVEGDGAPAALPVDDELLCVLHPATSTAATASIPAPPSHLTPIIKRPLPPGLLNMRHSCGSLPFR